MKRKSEAFFDAITLLPAEIVEEAQNYVFRKQYAAWKKFGSLAACAALVISLGMLAILPRGCGGGASGNTAPPATGESAPASCDTAAPSDMPQDPGDGGGYGSAESVQFTARVIDILDSGTKPAVLVEPLEGEAERNCADRIVVSADGEIPVLEAGDLICVTYDGNIQETYPARISGAQSIEKLEE